MSEIDRGFIGMATDPFTVEVEKGAIHRFCEALGETNPLYLDEAYARARGHAGVVAPPTFACTFRPPDRQSWLLPLEEGRILAGEQIFSYVRPLVAGDVLECRMHLLDIEEKQGRSGTMYLYQQEVRAVDAGGTLVVRNRRVVVYRSAGKLAAQPA